MAIISVTDQSAGQNAQNLSGLSDPSGANTPDAMGDRLGLLQEWVARTLGHRAWRIAPASNDASFRRYFRISQESASTGSPATLIVMDAPPDKEDCRPFIRVAQLFHAAGAHVPTVIAENLEQGFLLLSDLGDTTYLAALGNPDSHSAKPANDSADRLYRDAIAALISIQTSSRQGELPDYDRALLERELQLFPDWYIAKQLGLTLSAAQHTLLRQGFDAILDNNLAQPRVFVHRDYHCRNLMVCTQANPGVLDFQDAVHGPITYDLVSLLRDAYIAWPEERVIDWCVRYWETARKAALPVSGDFSEFYRDFEWMGAQRQIKVIGIFARLCHRDGKTAYLNDQPLVMAYLRRTCLRYRELAPLARLLDQIAPLEKSTGYTF